MAMVNLFESAHFDEEAYEAAVSQVSDAAESRYWLVPLAVTRAFAAYQTGEDYRKPLLEASKREGPFGLTAQSRMRVWIARVGFPAFFLTLGVVAGVGLGHLRRPLTRIAGHRLAPAPRRAHPRRP